MNNVSIKLISCNVKGTQNLETKFLIIRPGVGGGRAGKIADKF